MKASQIALYLNQKLNGYDMEINTISTIDNLNNNSICFVKKWNAEFIKQSRKKDVFVIASEDFRGKLNCSYCITDNPRRDFIRVLNRFFKPQQNFTIDENAKVLCSCNEIKVGAFSFIDETVKIGRKTIIGNNVSIMGNVTIGENCVIESGAVIGGTGFGYEYDVDGTPIQFYHSGGIEIGNNVYIGANTCIDRGTILSTVIEENVKIDNLVHIAHNCHIRKNSFIIANSVLCGGTEIGEHCTVAPNAVIKEQTKIADNCLIGLGSVVLKDTAANYIYAGIPAKIIKERK